MPAPGPGVAVLGQQPVDDVLEVALPWLRADLDPLEPLDAARADVAGHDHAHAARRGRAAAARRSSPRRAGPRARHALPSGIEPPKRWAGFASGHRSAPSKPTCAASRQRPGERDHVGERDAGPRRRAGRARTPRRLARDVADRDQARAPVAGALQRRRLGALPERLAQRRQREVELALHEPVDAQPPCGRVDLGNRAVPAHVERVRGGERIPRPGPRARSRR